jgi:hypothetical protein
MSEKIPEPKSSLSKMMKALKKATVATSQSIMESVSTIPSRMGWGTPPSRYAQETKSMENARRDLEQNGLREKFKVKVNSLERINDEIPSAEESLEAQSSIEMNPLLADNQRFDGIDPTVNPEPALNTDARREYDNQRREQEMEKQLRLGNMPQMGRQFNPRPERR